MSIEETARSLVTAIKTKNEEQAMIAVINVVVAAVKPLERIALSLESLLALQDGRDT